MDELKVFTGNAHPALAKAIVEYLGIPLGKCEVFQFTNDNTFVRILENVRQRDVFVVQPFSSPVNNNLVELLIMLDALKRAGVTQLISVSAVGSLREDLRPGTFVIVDQFIDRTFARERSFFGKGLVAHVSMAHPVCRRLGDHIEASARHLGMPVVRGGTYLAMEGPQFSSLAESECYRQWRCDVIGMTNMPEAKLAREAEICYATIAMVTDYDCWHPDHDHVTVDAIIRVLIENADRARGLLRHVLPKLREEADACGSGCRTALEYALITAPEAREPDMVKRLEAVAGRVLNR